MLYLLKYSILCYFSRGGESMEKITTIGILLKSLTNEYEKHLNQLLSSNGMTVSQCAVLNYLYETNKEYVNQKDIEQFLNLSNPTVTGLLHRLDEKGYVLVVQSAQDKRKKNVYLTEQALDMQKRIEASRKKIEREMLRGMKKTEITSMERSLEKMLRNIED